MLVDAVRPSFDRKPPIPTLPNTRCFARAGCSGRKHPERPAAVAEAPVAVEARVDSKVIEPRFVERRFHLHFVQPSQRQACKLLMYQYLFLLFEQNMFELLLFLVLKILVLHLLHE